MDYAFHIVVLLCIYVLLSLSLNLLVGYTGLLSICHAALYGLGAYTAGLLAVKLGWNFIPSMILAALVTGVVGAAIAVSLLYLHKNYFILATFGFQLIFSDIFNNWISLTNGPMGIAGIPRPTILKLTLSSQVNFAALGFLLAAFGYFIVKKIVNSSFGMVLRAIREDEIATLTLGKNVHKFKVAVFMISAAIAGVAGSLFAYYFSFIDPSSFGIEESIFILVLVILGGTASLNGSLLGVAVLLIVPEAFRFANLPDPIQANMRQIFYGLLLIIFMRLRPQGLIGEFDFKR